MKQRGKSLVLFPYLRKENVYRGKHDITLKCGFFEGVLQTTLKSIIHELFAY